MKKFLALFLATVATTAIGTGISNAETLRFGVKQESPSIDPHYSSNVSAVQGGRHIFDHLFNHDYQMKLQPGLALSIRAIDEKTWELKLRPNVKFHDGSPFTADDVIFSVKRANEMNSPSNFRQYTADKTLVKVDDLTVHVKTLGVNPLTDIDLSAFAMVSKKFADGSTQGDFVTGKATIGTGPYKFVSVKQGDSLNLVANPNYWGGKPKWDEVIFRPISSDPTRLAALKSGDIDIMDTVPTTDLPTLKKDPKFTVSEGPGNRPFYMWLDSRRHQTQYVTDNDGKPLAQNPLRDWRVRAALSKAINRVAIVERVFEGSASPSMQLLPDGFYGFNTDLKVAGEYDPNAAKKLLAEAGFPNGFRTVLHGTSGRYINDAKVLEAIAQMWTQVGVKTEVNTSPAQVFFERAAKMDYSTAIRTYSVATGEPSVQLKAIVHTNNIPGSVFCCSPSGYSNPRTDSIIEAALEAVDSGKREQLWKEAIGLAVKDYGIFGVYFEYYAWAAKAGLKYLVRLDGFNLAEDVTK